ncbi:hypothetical protein N9808_00390 [Hyphomicrobiales bacterium]|nr:hypothetical protein [Hyphomicrobiales bacterium]
MKKFLILFTIFNLMTFIPNPLFADICNCKGYSGPGGACYAGPGGPCYSGPGGGNSCPKVC